jgi:hypothetical protein
MTIDQMPFREWTQIAFDCMRENCVAEIEQINPAIKLARSGFGAAVRALGDELHPPVLAAKEREHLRGLAVFDLSQADASIVHQRHDEILRSTAVRVERPTRKPYSLRPR